MNISNETNNIMLDKKLWTKSYWEMLEILAYTSNTLDKINYFKLFVFIISKQIPCDICYYHFNELLKTEYYNIDNYLNRNGYNNIVLLKWVWEIHNNVNKRLNKSQYLFNDLLDKYLKSNCNDVCLIKR